MIADNLAYIRERIAEAAARAGRSPDDVRIVAAAKGQSLDRVREAIESGIRIFGHNYVQEAARQVELISEEQVELHMIGHLQKNKAGKAVEIFRTVETVDNGDLAAALDRRAELAEKTLGVLIQVNLSGEPQKSGTGTEQVAELARKIRSLPHLQLRGLMTMPPFFDDPERARPYFARLRELRRELIASGVFTPDMTELSMGMTGDFEVAVEEGATLVRIGTALFGPRT
ncbi:MAG: YggS family pyridoxal phosphate-dependent enzyme [Desulfomonile sp.]|nr:YggS family pyridoxal phosphate-dependent enzyme [Desulfomonile sp.]